MNSSTQKAVTYLVALAFGMLALFGIVGLVIAMMGDTDDQPSLSAAAQPYQQDLEQAAQQCPTVLTAQRLDRYIADSTGWDAEYESPVWETVSVAGVPEEMWESTGGGDPNDVPTAIRNVANLWCGYSTALAGEDIDFDYDLPAPANDDDDPRAAALGLAAIFMGMDNVRSGQVPVNHHPVVADAMRWIL